MSDTIKIITEPVVYLVGRQSIDTTALESFLSDHSVMWSTDTEFHSEELVEVAGRLCYMSFSKPRPGGNKAYIDHILEVGHGSVCEHAVWNFIFTGVSRSLTHELVRHRAGAAYSQLSQRYVDESVAEYVEPDIIAADPELHAIWLEAVANAHRAYVRLADRLISKQLDDAYQRERDKQDGLGLDWSDKKEIKTELRKAARQAARSVLPNATETKIFVTFNARSCRHFIEMRASRHAEPEIRKLAVKVLKIMQGEAPNLFSDYTLTPLPDGTEEATTPNRKV